ncbi:MAG TPA: branched-chain amino acid ABC transporter permease [Mesotoga infera]|nr:branched-chain amino acid ABC transporter permease [Mesotoga sp.]HON28862.1 branched-chain amino acid ABC transporter permease [Mesotoga infera]HPD38641.1 branched-chain amino acid ABC transporter permease [Mesotoga infera]HRR44840.1 branched-chain amino acid ABC transporter permease [Mesotoga sp.]HRV02227.1 branched-chain amino acid ABC transporter permease [Mesotoga sp.]
MLLSLLVNSFLNGSIYMLLAVGFSLVFGVAGVVNLYHGAYYMLAGYLAYTMFSIWSFPLWLSCVVAVFLVGMLGVFIMRVPLTYLKNTKKESSLLIFTLGASYFTEYLLRLIFGARHYSLPSFMWESVNLLGETIPGARVFATITSIVCIVLTVLFLKTSRTGREIVATSQDRLGAEAIGIDTTRVFAITAFISAALAGIAGVAVSPFLAISPVMWLPALIKPFSIVILGGLGSIWGTIIASFLMGFGETLVATYWTPNLREIVFLIAVIIVLIIRPKGLLGGVKGA